MEADAAKQIFNEGIRMRCVTLNEDVYDTYGEIETLEDRSKSTSSRVLMKLKEYEQQLKNYQQEL
ncbi:hypothetical protein C1645_789223, partial [Glomus cerebriforme]